MIPRDAKGEPRARRKGRSARPARSYTERPNAENVSREGRALQQV